MNTISIIGLSKNAGKTTLLNVLIQSITIQKESKIGIASVGVDGEASDQWSGRIKPAIHVPKTTVVATTMEGLTSGTANWRVLDRIFTSKTGDVYLAEAIEPGSAKLVGIKTMGEIKQVLELAKKYNVEEFFVDGAYDRFASSNPMIIQQVFLVIGAILDNDERVFRQLVKERLYHFFIPRLDDYKMRIELLNRISNQNIWYKTENGWNDMPSQSLLIGSYDFGEEIELIYIPGILTENMMLNFLNQKRGFQIVLNDGVKNFASSSYIEKWKNKGGDIKVLYPIRIKGIAINPYSPTGYSFSATHMKKAISNILESYRVINIPIFDVWRDKINI